MRLEIGVVWSCYLDSNSIISRRVSSTGSFYREGGTFFLENISGAARTTRWDIISLRKKRPAKIKKKKMNEELPFSTFTTEFVCFDKQI